jgi:hypothetical protein
MVKSFISAALAWCWSVLLRSVSPAVRAVAVNPLSSSEVPLGPSCRFKLSSVVTSPPPDVADDIAELLGLRRSAFARGELFGPLEQIGNSGAILLAHITERGFITAEHFLAVYPPPDNRAIETKPKRVWISGDTPVRFTPRSKSIDRSQ